ncbi:Major Facilitator Superfamily protein [Aquimixticola soesokkakensis]|uniref:Major Facilitator Superfamily protein n=1 Tax=Aquimixticola soesokkakensis TaxID=1519096 RepID=A0A1Y5T6E8_9RHOB|nr:MFS transporter [Aquimixticola soesokkakensis]SLN56921.1 Major Facilitator Superfamily protein [Aquimixticola soesokkakensis]
MTAPIPPASPTLYGTLSLTTLSQIAATSSVLALTTIPTVVADALHVSPHVLGYQVSLIYAAGIVFSMVSSSMVKRWGAGRVGQLALLGAGLGFIGMASGTIVGMALASALIGIGYALNNPSSSHILSRLAPRARRNLIFSIKQAGVPLGGVLAALGIPPLAHAIGWQATLALFGLFPLALAAIYHFRRASWDTDRQPQVTLGRGIIAGQKLVWRTANLRALAILGFLYSAVQLSISTFTVTMLIEDFGWNAIKAASLAAALQAFGAVGRVIWGLAADRVNSGFLVLSFIGLVTGGASLGFALTGSAPLIGLAAIFASGLTGLGWNGVLLAETADASPGPGTLTGEVLTYTFVGVMVGPASFALAYEIIGNYAGTFVLFSALSFIGCALAFARHMGRRRAKPLLA